MTESETPKSRLPCPVTLVLIALVLLIGGGSLMVWLPYHHNQTVIAEVERLGGYTESEIVRPAWISDAVDDEYLGVFARVFRVILDDTQINDAGLEHLHGPTSTFTVPSVSNTWPVMLGFEDIHLPS